MVFLVILIVILATLCIFLYQKYNKEKSKFESYKRSIKNENSWHEVGRQDVTSKPYSIKDGDWIVGPGLNTPAYLSDINISNVRDLMNHAFRQGKL